LRTIGAATQTTAFGYDNNSNLVALTVALASGSCASPPRRCPS
jgi:hypothetical protein